MYSGCKMSKYVFWSVVDFSFEKDTIGHIFTGQYYGLHTHNIYIIVKLHRKQDQAPQTALKTWSELRCSEG